MSAHAPKRSPERSEGGEWSSMGRRSQNACDRPRAKDRMNSLYTQDRPPSPDGHTWEVLLYLTLHTPWPRCTFWSTNVGIKDQCLAFGFLCLCSSRNCGPARLHQHYGGKYSSLSEQSVILCPWRHIIFHFAYAACEGAREYTAGPSLHALES